MMHGQKKIKLHKSPFGENGVDIFGRIDGGIWWNCWEAFCECEKAPKYVSEIHGINKCLSQNF